MPVINIEYDDSKIKDSEILHLSESIQKIVSQITSIKDVFVYANSARIKINIAPIEIFVQMSANKIKDSDKLIEKIKSGLIIWKSKNSFKHNINLSLIPMDWKVEIGI